MNIAAGVVALARAAGQTITTAESCTGGLVAAALTDVAGASTVFGQGYVTYSNAAKISLLNVSAETLDTYGAVSEETACAMAEGALRGAKADLAIAITGIAGPGGSEHKPEGRVCFALACSGTLTHSETVEFGPLGRAEVRGMACNHALDLLKRSVSQFSP